MCVAVLSLPHLTPQFEVNARQLMKRVKHLASILYHFWRRWSTWISSERATVTQRRSLWVTLLCPREMLLSSMTMLYHVGSGKLDGYKRISPVVMNYPELPLWELLQEIISMFFWEGHYNFSIHWSFTKMKHQKLTLKMHVPPCQMFASQPQLKCMIALLLI